MLTFKIVSTIIKQDTFKGIVDNPQALINTLTKKGYLTEEGRVTSMFRGITDDFRADLLQYNLSNLISINEKLRQAQYAQSVGWNFLPFWFWIFWS